MNAARWTTRPGLTVAAVVAVALLSACSTPTPYAPALDGKGYSQQQLEDKRYRVSFSGNSLTPRETVENYLLYRAAEITLETGNGYFRIVERDLDAKTRYRSTISGFGHGFHPFWYHHSPFVGGGFATTTARPITSYQAFANIIVLDDDQPGDDDRIYNARDVIEKLGPTIVRPDVSRG